MRRRAKHAESRTRAPRHGRHGREGRSAVVRPPLPPLETCADRFDLTDGTTAEFLSSAWEELRDVRFEIADLPPTSEEGRIPRWRVLAEEKRIILYRIPIERLGHLHRNDDFHRRMLIESYVFRAAAAYLERDPWDLGPERFRYF